MDIFMYICVIFIGICAGIFTGLLPGIHINMVASFVFVNISFLLGIFNVKLIVIFILTMGVVHSFIDFIPSVIFGVPSADNALSVLPAHRLVQEGEGYYAIVLSAAGSLAGVFFALFFMPIFYLFLESLYDFMKKYIAYLLMFVLCMLVGGEEGLNKKFWALIIVLFSGGLGSLVLNSKFSYMPLLVLFSGLFGISSIITSLISGEAKLPQQKFESKVKLSKDFFKASLFGSIASAFCLVIPGIGNSQAATVVSLFFKKITSELFIVVVGVINTFSFFMSLMTFHLISRSRNGSFVVVSQIVDVIDLTSLKEMLVIMIIVGIIGFVLTLVLGKIVIKMVVRINMNILNLLILSFLIFIVLYLTNWFGFLVLICSTFLGLLCINLNVRRVHLMSILIIPIIINLV